MDFVSWGHYRPSVWHNYHSHSFYEVSVPRICRDRDVPGRPDGAWGRSGRPAHHPLGSASSSPLTCDLATRAYEVLHTWRRCPGVGPDGWLDSDALVGWVLAAREQLRADDRLGSGDEQIGRILAFAPQDDDGMCPARAVRDLLEEIRSRRLESGLGIGILNRRGTTIRDSLEGGDQEWKLAESYRKQAESATH